MICLALAKICKNGIELYEAEEGGLKTLPEISKRAILALGVVSIATSTKEIEIAAFNDNDSLRSIRFIYNLLEMHGKKRCAFCECEIPQIVQGAHIWPVAAIKNEQGMGLDEKLHNALNGHNGLWLCENHHKLLDARMLYLTESGSIKYRNSMSSSDLEFLKKITTSCALPQECLHADFLKYVGKHNYGYIEAAYTDLV